MRIPRPIPRQMRRAATRAAAVLFAVVPVLPSAAGAQMPSVPLLQGPFRNPGATVGVFGARGDGTSAAGAAVAIVPSARWLQVTVGGGYADAGASVATYGGRVAVSLRRFVPFLRSDAIGVAVYAGLGGGMRDSITLLALPAGVTVGYRRPLGSTRMLSVYASPFFSYSQSDGLGLQDGGKGLVRVSAGVDVAVTRRIGLSVGAEGGAVAKDAQPGPRSMLYGAGISFALR